VPHLLLLVLTGSGGAVLAAAVRRRGAARLVMTALATSVLATVVVVPLAADHASAASAKITICHRTHSTTNPYRRITVSQNAVTNSRHGGHDGPVFDPTYDYPPNQKIWGDIIPGGDADGLPYNGSNAIAENWTVEGKAAFAAHCAPMSAKGFYDVELAAGVPPVDIIADLNSQAANEDAALLAALGGTFTLDTVSTWETTVSATTTAATDVTTTSATLNGSLKVGPTTTATGFEWGTSATLSTSTAIAATPASVVSTTSAVSTALAGLSAGTTYYFRVTGTTDAGLDTEGILYGNILSFTTASAAGAAQTITFATPSDMVLGDGTRTATATATSGLAVTFSSGSTAVCTVTAGGVATAVAAGTCSITAAQGGDGTWAAAPSVTRTFAVTAVARTLAIDSGSYDADGYVLPATPPMITSTPSAGAGDTTYSSSTPAVCTVAAATGVVSLVSAGSCTIGATIVADGIYGAATATAVTFPVAAPTTTTTAPPTTSTTAPAPSTTTTTAPGPSTTTAPGPSTTTTLPPTTTPPPTTVPSRPISEAQPTAAPDQVEATIRGVAWFDRNRNGVFDGREWVLPGVAVTLTPAEEPVAVGAFHAAGVLRAAAVEQPASTITGPDGSYVFSRVVPGAYRVAASTSIRGFDYTSDTDGDLDWSVQVAVAAREVGVAEFAGMGRGELGGRMFETGTLEGLAFAAITCRWAGYDDALGTADDVSFEVTATSDGAFDLEGVPYGSFTCSGVDAAGRRAESLPLTVLSPDRVFAPLPVDIDRPTLPVTGADPSALGLVGVLLVAGGTLLVVGSRRRRLRSA
jgi:LPXTG-motif cell wall-anchored protein